jgi:hypothetical protein
MVLYLCYPIPVNGVLKLSAGISPYVAITVSVSKLKL